MAVSVSVLLDELSKRQITLYVQDGRLKYKAPSAVLTDELLLQIRNNKDEILALLRARTSPDRNIPAIMPREGTPDEPVPLSSAQQAFWFRDRLLPGNPAYNVATGFRLRGPYHLPALEKAVAFLVARHDSLRTVFTTRNELPVQVVRPHVDTPLKISDLRELPEESREKKARAEITAEAQHRFDLEAGPLFRVTVVLLGEQELLLLVCMHHIISDRWSVRLLLREFRIAYEAYAAGSMPVLPRVPLQLSDYAFWQRDFLASDSYRKQLEYWKTKLANAPGILELPLDSPRPPFQTHHGAKRSFRVPKILAESLNAIAKRLNVSLFMLFVAAFKVLLYRYSGEEDICIGFPVADRSHAALEPVVGLFLNTLLLRTDLSGDPAFSVLLRQVRENTLAAYENQDVPFERLVEELQPERDSSHFPLFQVMVVFQNRWPEDTNFPGLQLEMLELSTQATMFDLTLSLAEEADAGISGFFRYNADLFTGITIERMTGDLMALLEGIAMNPELPIALLPMLAKEDLKAIAPAKLVEINLPFIEFPAAALESSITERFAWQVARCSENIALRSENTAWTYRELDAIANNIAREILRHSSGATGGCIGLLVEHAALAVASMLGALKAGCVYVPLEPSYPVERLRYILDDAQVFLVLTSSQLLARTREAAGGEHPIVQVDTAIAAAPAPQAMLPVSPQAVACLLYTSGSTGRPKGALQTHQHVLHVIRNYTNRLHISESDRLLLLASFVHVASLPDIYAALLNGAAVCLYDIKNQGMTGLPEWLRDVGVTIYHSVPTVYRLLLDSAPQPVFLQSIRAVILGGEEVFMRDVAAYQRTFGDECVFVNMYGSTESTVTTMGVLNKASSIERDPVPVGMPVGANEVLLLGRSGKPTSIVGEIAVRHPYLPADHWNRHGSESPFYLDGNNRCVYRTGDQGRLLTDGNLVLLGRKDFQVKIRGFRVELGEIEAMMSRCAGVGQAIVVARKDPLGNKRLAAYIVPANKEAPPDPKELRNELRQLVPAYMVPELIVQLEKAAYTTTGKIDRNNLPALDWSEIGTGSEYVEPRNDLERRVCGIWREVLKLDRISIHDNFFDLGGHSLLAIQILERIRKECNATLPIHELFGMPTIAAVAAAMEEKQRSAAEMPVDAPLVPVARRRHASGMKEAN